MPAYVNHDFPKKFDLDEEKLRRIIELIKERIPFENHEKITFQVSRRDSFIYKTDAISIVLAEDNDSTKLINSIKINYEDEELKTSIYFDSSAGCEISIEGEDRDRVFLLSSSLKEYIGKEVTTYFRFPFGTRAILPLMMVIFFSYMIYIVNNIIPPNFENDIAAIIKSNDINEKLNFIINNKGTSSNPLKGLTYLFALTIIPVILVVIPIKKIISFIYPMNNFLFGKQKLVISKRKDLYSKIFWGVIISAAVGFTVSLYFAK